MKDGFLFTDFRCYYINGRSVVMKPVEVFPALVHPYTVITLLGSVVVVLIVDPHGVASQLTRTSYVISFFIIYIFSFFNFGLFVLGTMWIARLFDRSSILFSLPLITSTVLNTLAYVELNVLLGIPRVSWQRFVVMSLINIVAFEMLNTALGNWFVPRIVRERREAQSRENNRIKNSLYGNVEGLPHDPSVSANRSNSTSRTWIEVLGLEASQLIRIEAQENYVLIVSISGSQLVRTPLTKIVEEIPPGIGTRVHRSHWLAANAEYKLSTVSGKRYAVFSDGKRVPISPLFAKDFGSDQIREQSSE